MKSCAAVLLATILSAPIFAHAQEAEMPKPDSFRIGDYWEWRQVDARTKLEEGQRTRTVVEQNGIVRFSYGGARRAFTGQISNAYLGNSSAKKPWRVWPLRVGATWAHDEEWRRPDGVSGSTQADVRVTSFEEVEVPSGKYMAFKIEHKGHYHNSAGGSGFQRETYWYAPEVAADVKHTYDDGFNPWVRELTVYKRGTP